MTERYDYPLKYISCRVLNLRKFDMYVFLLDWIDYLIAIIYDFLSYH